MHLPFPVERSDESLHMRAREIRLDAVERAQFQLYEKLEENTSTTNSIKATTDDHAAKLNEIKSDTSDIVEAFQAAKGAFKVLGFLGKAAKWATGLIAFFTACWGAWQVLKTGLPK